MHIVTVIEGGEPLCTLIEGPDGPVVAQYKGQDAHQRVLDVMQRAAAPPFTTGLSPAETERLALFSEECAEGVKEAMKILRHGYESFDPTKPCNPPTNRVQLAREIGNIEHAIFLLKDNGDVSAHEVENSRRNKAASVRRWMHFQTWK